MSDVIIPRGLLTDYLVDTLESWLSATGILVGDGIAPEPGGWTGGQPGEGDFVPYIVLGTGPAIKGPAQPTISRKDASWNATYTLRSVGALRQQCDWAADKTRLVMGTFQKQSFVEGWTIVLVDYTQLGPVSRNDATTPPYWEVTDTVALWLERDR